MRNPGPAAASLVPSADEARHDQKLFGDALGVQLEPEFVETKIKLPNAAAAILVPSAEQLTQFQWSFGRFAGVHFVPELVER
jgi:hypothetical protein